MMALLVIVTLSSSLIGYYLLQDAYHTEETRHETLAKQRLQLSANTVGNQVRLYQGMVDLLAGKNTTVNLLSLAGENETEQWTAQVRSMMPGILGLGLAQEGKIIGDPLVQRIGPLCEQDLEGFTRNQPLPYPPVHDRIKGLEHFDLFAGVDSVEDDVSGVLLVSFPTKNLHRIMRDTRAADDLLLLRTSDGREIARTGSVNLHDALALSAPVPNTPWTMHLYTPPVKGSGFFQNLVLFNLVLLLLVSGLLMLSTRHFARLICIDVRRIHDRINAVLDGKKGHEKNTPAIKEIAFLLPDIDRVAQTMRRQHEQLRDQALTDPLTQLRNRRYFNLVTEQAFRQSRRERPQVMLLIEANDFKLVNDTKGHDVGDLMLNYLAGYLHNHIRSSDEVMRIGGDEFAVLLRHMEPQQVEPWLQQFTQGYDRELADHKPPGLEPNTCTLSIGVAAVDATRYGDVEEILQAADQAMYRAKSKARGSSRYHISTGFFTRDASTT